MIVYKCDRADNRHRYVGWYIDIYNCFELPVGPFPGSASAHQWISENAERITELYGDENRRAFAQLNVSRYGVPF